MDSLLTYGQVAKLLRVSVRTVQSLYYDEKLKGLKVGRQVRFTEDSIRQFIETPKRSIDSIKVNHGKRWE